MSHLIHHIHPAAVGFVADDLPGGIKAGRIKIHYPDIAGEHAWAIEHGIQVNPIALMNTRLRGLAAIAEHARAFVEADFHAVLIAKRLHLHAIADGIDLGDIAANQSSFPFRNRWHVQQRISRAV